MLIIAGIFCAAVLLIAEVPSGTISRAMPLKRLSVTRVAMTGVIRSFITLNPLSAPISTPAPIVTSIAGTNANPLRIISENTTALRLIALPTERSM